MDAARRLIAWRGRGRGIQVFASVGGVLAEHLAEAQRRATRGGSVQIAHELAQETIVLLRALAAEIPHPYLVSFVTAGGWRAEMRLAAPSGRLVVSELHVRPVAADRMPPGGLTARALRRVPLHAGVTEFAGMLRGRREDVEALLVGTGLEEMLSAHLGTPSSRHAPRHTGRRPLQTDVLLRVAAAYAVAYTADPRRPVAGAATRLDMTIARVRDLVHKARLRGLLTPVAQGRPGGALTPSAKALLKTQSRLSRSRRRKLR
jgi:hypothetical protein